jgi:hypothetical protein
MLSSFLRLGLSVEGGGEDQEDMTLDLQKFPIQWESHNVLTSSSPAP